MEQTTSATPTPCRLQQLPNELRNRIFALAVIKDGSILVSKKIISSDKHVVRPMPPPLAYTCRQFYHEVLPVYYGNNTFVAYAAVRAHPSMPNKFSEMSTWLKEAEDRAKILDKQQDQSAAVARNIKLVISHLPYDTATGDTRRWGTLLIHAKDGGIEIEPGGIFGTKCICFPRRLVSRYQDSLTKLVVELEKHCTEHLLFSKLRFSYPERQCVRCGLLRTVPPGQLDRLLE